MQIISISSNLFDKNLPVTINKFEINILKNKELVFNIIKKSSKNLTAYEILDKLQKFKKTQPMTVYRALDRLTSNEKIHKSNQTKRLKF